MGDYKMIYIFCIAMGILIGCAWRNYTYTRFILKALKNLENKENK